MQWAVRIVHEASMHDANCMLTLTYDPEHRPGALQKADLQGFMHRLRKRVAYDHEGARIRFFAPGEYGEISGHPHFHPLIFGWFPPDAVPLPVRGDRQAWRSELVEDVWGMGICQVDALTPGTAAYAAGYVAKKFLDGQVEPELELELATGELRPRQQEFVLMSRRPGVGAGWIDRHQADAYPDDFIVLGGVKVGKPPRFYDERVKRSDPELIESIKAKRVEAANLPKAAWNSTRDRLTVRETVAKAKLRLGRRSGV